jgi:hypothetical protein
MAPPVQLHQRAAWQPGWNQTALIAKPVAFRFRFQAALSRQEQGCWVPWQAGLRFVALCLPLLLPELGCCAKMAANAAQSHPISPPSAVAA